MFVQYPQFLPYFPIALLESSFPSDGVRRFSPPSDVLVYNCYNSQIALMCEFNEYNCYSCPAEVNMFVALAPRHETLMSISKGVLQILARNDINM